MITKLSSLPHQPNITAKNSCNKNPGFKGAIIIENSELQGKKKVAATIKDVRRGTNSIVKPTIKQRNELKTGFFFNPNEEEQKEMMEGLNRYLLVNKINFTCDSDMTKKQFEKEMQNN